MKVYEAVYIDEQKQGVYGISLVENPAMQDEWIALSEQEQTIEFAAVDETKHLLLGAVLIPDKKIYRNIGGNEFYITFTEETIGNLAHDFIKNGFQNNSTSEHETKLSDVSFVESWQVEDPSVDKSALYGKTYEKGTWVTMAKVSPEIYEQATNGTFNGFSIDALLGLKEVNFNSNLIDVTMTKQDFLDAFKAMFSAPEEVVEEVKAEEVEVKTEEVVEEVSAAPSEELSVDDVKNMLTEMLTEFSTNQDKKLKDFKTEFSKQVEEKEVEVKELKAELSKQPEVAPIVLNAETAPVELTAQGELLSLMRNNK